MTDPLYHFQLQIFNNGRLLMQTEWTPDKDAVIEAMDSINRRKCVDIRSHFRYDSIAKRSELRLLKNYNELVVAYGEYEKLSYLDTLINRRDCRGLRCGVITRGNGGVSLDHPVFVGG